MPRIAAWNVLRSGSPTPLRAVDRFVGELEPRDAALARRIVGTEVRRRGTLRAVVRKLQHRDLKPDLAAHLHVGLTQLLFLDRVPDHAAVSETLGAVERTLGQSKVPLVNAILRATLRLLAEGHSGDPRRDVVGRALHFNEPVFRAREAHPFLWAEDALSIPAHMLKRWTKAHGSERAEALARAALDEPPVCVRGVRLERDAVIAALAAEGIEARPGAHARSARVRSEDAARLVHCAPFRAGALVVQGEAALLAAELVGACAGERVLDLCAAPGGKTMALLETGAHVTAVDASAERMPMVGEAAARLGLGAGLRTLVADATQWSDAVGPEEDAYDAALVDAPCTNTGVLAARPGARWRFGPAALRALSALQERLLAAAAARVRPGGRLVWSTCSLEPEEGGQRVRRFLETHPSWSLEFAETSLPCGALADEPENERTAGATIDGGYRALLVRATS